MKASVFARWLLICALITMIARPVFAQDVPPTDQSQDQPPPPDDNPGATPTATPTPDPATVIAQWGPAPSIGADADLAVAVRWFRDQNATRAHWGVPTATQDPYLDWEAENLMRSRLGQPSLAPPQGLTKPPAAVRSSQTDRAVLSQPQFWTISDDLWLAWLEQGHAQTIAFWQGNHPDENWYTPERYFRIEEWRQEKFDRYRLLGIAGRVNMGNSAAADLLPGHKDELEQLAPGSVATYQPLVYSGNGVAVVAYDPWINPDGSLRQ